jgi:hypothetical protein
MVIVLLDQLADTPGGKPVAAPIPVAPVVVRVIAVMGALTQMVAAADAVTVLGEGHADLRASSNPPIVRGFVFTVQFKPPNPVAPAVGSKAQAAPTAGVLAVLVPKPLSYISLNEPNVAVVHDALS